MRKRILGGFARLVVVMGFAVVLAAQAHAAGEWEWTAGQGWIRGAGVARPTPKEQLHYAYELEKRGEYMDSARQYFLLVQNFPSSEEAGVGLQRLARCLFEMENYYTSYKAIEQVIETYPNTGRMSDLVEIELRIAKKLMVSQTPDILSGREDNIRDHNVRRALEIIDSVIDHDPYGPVAAEAYLVKGEGNMFINEVQKARAAFEIIRDEFPRSDFYERARLGILTCDSLMGQAKPQEVQEQIEVVREAERERAQRRREELDEMDDVEESIRQLAEIEAAKMMDQAEQYRRMGTRDGVKASQFLYKEIVRRYPGTVQAEESMGRLGDLKIPKEQGRIAKTIKNINLNPFTYNRDPEPPWIVPQLDPDDMVMVDAGVGPIVGVPETGLPRTDYSAGVRPAGLREPEPTASSARFSPISSAPPADPEPPPLSPRQRQQQRRLAEQNTGLGPDPTRRPPPPNPLPTISSDDLIGAPGMARRPAANVDPRMGAGTGAAGEGYVHPYELGGVYGGGGNVGRASGYDTPTPNAGGTTTPTQDIYQHYDNTPVYPGGIAPPPSLGTTTYHTPYSDLVGVSPDDRRAYSGAGYGGGYSPAPTYQDYTTQNNYSQGDGYTQSYPLPSPVTTPQGGGYSSGNGGWTFSEDLR